VIKDTEVGGVTTLLAPTSGPMLAGLTFRVGRADEPLARSGITHLIEHLALHHLGMADYHFNGATGVTVTTFHTQGSADDVAAFLTGVCTALADLPIDRLEMEREILRTEEANRSRSVTEPLSLWRYGARGYGLLSYPEWGLPMVGAGELHDWVRRYFTRQNAVLWIAGPDVPAGLRLPLPEGVRQPLPPPTNALPATPAFFAGSTRAVALDSLVRRRTAGGVFAGVLERELFRELRQESGLSYTAAAVYEPRDTTYATLTALVDALPEKKDAALGGFIDVLAKLRVGRIAQSDVDAVVAKNKDVLDHPEVHAGRLPSYAFNVLIGYENISIEQLRTELAEVTAADIHEVAQEATASGLLMVPDGHDARWAGFVAAPTRSERAVNGLRYQSKETADVGLVVGADGASIVAPDGIITVRFNECAALLAWPDGGRIMIGDDAISLRVEPTLYTIDPAVVSTIDNSVPRANHIAMPAREPDEIPQPAPPAPPPQQPAGTPSALETVTLFVVGIAAVLFVCLGALTTLGVGAAEDSKGGEWAVVGSLWCVAVVLILPTILLLRRRRAARRPR
jgi:zinc protease